MKFSELMLGDSFVSVSANQDVEVYVFVKISFDTINNAVRRMDGTRSSMPPTMPVVKVLL